MVVPDMHQVLVLHSAHDAPLAPSYPGAHAQSVWSALPLGLWECAEHAWQEDRSSCSVSVWNVSEGHKRHASTDTCAVRGWYLPAHDHVEDGEKHVADLLGDLGLYTLVDCYIWVGGAVGHHASSLRERLG